MRLGLAPRPQLKSIAPRPWLAPPSRGPWPARNASSNRSRDRASSLEARETQSPLPTFELGDEKTRAYWTTQGRHLLRAILRECTYLPDPRAREYIHSYAVSRFRKYAWKLWKESDVATLGPRLEKKRKEARQCLNLLKRANEGDTQKLLRVLFVTYGRVGRRRRELLLPLLVDADYAVGGDDVCHGTTPEKETSVGEGHANLSTKTFPTRVPKRQSRIPEFETVPSNDENVARLRPRLNPMLRALAQSQINANLPTIHRGALRTLYLEHPKLNTWHRPMPQKRIKNMLAKWRAELLARIHAPLSTAEWERLRSLATGRELPPTPIPIPYRKRVGHPDVSEAPEPSVALTALVVRGTISLTPGPRRAGDAGSVTARKMQRLWTRVFQLCPRMDWDVGKKRWDVTWGG